MRKVADILNRKGASAVAVAPDLKAIDALRIMSEKNIGSLLVMDGGEYLGLVTERDFTRKILFNKKDPAITRVSEIMIPDLPAVLPTDSVEYCMQLMVEKKVRYLPVFENSLLSGIISMRDLVKETILEQKEKVTRPGDIISN